MITYKNKKTSTEIRENSSGENYIEGLLLNDITLKPYEEKTLDTGVVICLTQQNEFVFVRGEENESYVVTANKVQFHSDRLISGKFYKELQVCFHNISDKDVCIESGTKFMDIYATEIKGFNVVGKYDKLTKLKETDLGDGFYAYYDEKKYEAFQEPTLIKADDTFLSGGFLKKS